MIRRKPRKLHAHFILILISRYTYYYSKYVVFDAFLKSVAQNRREIIIISGPEPGTEIKKQREEHIAARIILRVAI